MENAERVGERSRQKPAGTPPRETATEGSKSSRPRENSPTAKSGPIADVIEPAGKSALPPARTNTMAYDITRRKFLKLSGAVATTAFIGISCDGGGSSSNPEGSVEVFKLSVRGRRGSNASKKHNANHLFLTPLAADQNRAHPGDNSRIVPVILSQDKFNELFQGGAVDVVDMRAIF